MDITFNCDKCGQEIIIEESGAGLHVECPKCTASIIVPSPNIRISEKRLRLKPRVEDNSSRLNPNLNDILPQTQAAAKSFKTLPKFLTVLVIIVIGYCSVKYFADKSPQNLSKTDSSLRSVERPHQETFDFYGSEQDAKADMLYAEFENAVHSKDIDKAIAFQRSVTGVFTNKTQTEQFWCKKIPLYAQRTLVLAYACPDCNDGICGECTGKKICKKCDGNKQCVQCLGNGALTEKCIRCICSLCKGNRACKACNGRKFFKCPTCNGDSQVVGEPTHSPCVRCSGTGRLKSGFKDSNTTLPCVACASKGYFEMTSMVQCSTCRGSGAVNCQNCNGTGRCSSCQGNGRFARCSLCFSTGVIRRECRSCSGNGVCAT